MKRSGFTMIELIFVIVILGILAAVAVPRLSATRDDAKISKMGSDVATLITDAGGYWTANGAWPSQWDDMTNIPLSSSAGGANGVDINVTSTAYINAGTTGATDGCFSIASSTDGNITVTSLAAGTSSVCTGAKNLANNANTSAAAGKVHSFGGSGVSY